MTGTASTVAVIGGGFSGTAVAVNLLRRGRPMRIVLVNRYGPIGRGVAYRTRIEAHVLNVPAGGMSALPSDPDHFLRWARERDPSVGAGTFVSRRLYGEYLGALLREAEAAAPEGARLERVVGEVRDLTARELGATLLYADGTRLDADHVVLALGNYSPNDPPAQGAEFYASSRYVRDPWIRGSLDAIRPGEIVLLLGTGLTMMDIALDLSERGVGIPLHAVSRHGLLPQSHAPSSKPAPRPDLEGLPKKIAAYTRAVRAAVTLGGDWRGTIGALRASTPSLWERLPVSERARFLRHVRPYWDVHRHRAAPATAEAVANLMAEGALRVRAGRVLRYEPAAEGVRVLVRPRGSSTEETLTVERVVNCTGPSSDVRRVGDALLDALLAKGLIRPDPLGLGIETAEDGALLDAEGRPSATLSLVGPLLKPRFWEATAVPELRQHAARLAERLLP